MRFLLSAVLYTALTFGANAQGFDFAPYLTGDMAKLVPGAEPVALPSGPLVDETDAPRSLEEYRGKIVLVNFWATWCAPCRKELGSLDRLQAALGSDRFAVVTIASGPNPLPAIDKLFADEAITTLPKLRDPDQSFSRAAGVLGLPVTLILDSEGREIARLMGEAAWDGPEAQALVAALIAAPPG